MNKNNGFILLFSLLVLPFTVCNSQCPGFPIELTNQESIDNFQINYPDCVEKGAQLVLFGDDINNLNGLLGIKSMSILRLEELPNIQNLSGLDSLKTIRIIDIGYNENLEEITALNNLDSVETLTLSFNEHITELSVFEGIKALNTLRVFGDGSLEGLNYPLTHKVLDGIGNGNSGIYIFKNSIANSLEGILNYSETFLDYLKIYDSANITFQGLSQLDSIHSLSFTLNDSIQLIGLENIKNIREFEWHNNDFTGNNIQYNFENLQKINHLDLLENYELETLENYFPVLDSIGQSISFQGNFKLRSLAPLDSFEAPTDTLAGWNSQNFRIQLRHNPLIENCDTYLLCKGKEIYPDSVLLEFNGMNCDEAWFDNLDCSAVLSQEEIQLSHLNIYPNPTTDIVYIESKNGIISDIEIYDVSGKLISKKRNTSSIDLKPLQNGIYTFLVKTEKGNYRKRVLKI